MQATGQTGGLHKTKLLIIHAEGGTEVPALYKSEENQLRADSSSQAARASAALVVP